jgi:hypothetical protein
VCGGGEDGVLGGAQQVRADAPNRLLSDNGGGSYLGPGTAVSTWVQQRCSSHGN